MDDAQNIPPQPLKIDAMALTQEMNAVIVRHLCEQNGISAAEISLNQIGEAATLYLAGFISYYQRQTGVDQREQIEALLARYIDGFNQAQQGG
jgi:hypothetical protein